MVDLDLLRPLPRNPRADRPNQITRRLQVALRLLAFEEQRLYPLFRRPVLGIFALPRLQGLLAGQLVARLVLVVNFDVVGVALVLDGARVELLRRDVRSFHALLRGTALLGLAAAVSQGYHMSCFSIAGSMRAKGGLERK